ncbi:MAG: hypothetical protein IJ593_02870 [Lachnospiraceae bacterium]|nr:hypothetical protein [Lachnospiraceae bacterium]
MDNTFKVSEQTDNGDCLVKYTLDEILKSYKNMGLAFRTDYDDGIDIIAPKHWFFDAEEAAEYIASDSILDNIKEYYVTKIKELYTEFYNLIKNYASAQDFFNEVLRDQAYYRYLHIGDFFRNSADYKSIYLIDIMIDEITELFYATEIYRFMESAQREKAFNGKDNNIDFKLLYSTDSRVIADKESLLEKLPQDFFGPETLTDGNKCSVFMTDNDFVGHALAEAGVKHEYLALVHLVIKTEKNTDKILEHMVGDDDAIDDVFGYAVQIIADNAQ